MDTVKEERKKELEEMRAEIRKKWEKTGVQPLPFLPRRPVENYIVSTVFFMIFLFAWGFLDFREMEKFIEQGESPFYAFFHDLATRPFLMHVLSLGIPILMFLVTFNQDFDGASGSTTPQGHGATYHTTLSHKNIDTINDYGCSSFSHNIHHRH